MDDAMVREISITRIFAAPRDLVWRAWTEAEQLARWFMPHGFTVPAVRHGPPARREVHDDGARPRRDRVSDRR